MPSAFRGKLDQMREQKQAAARKPHTVGIGADYMPLMGGVEWLTEHNNAYWAAMTRGDYPVAVAACDRIEKAVKGEIKKFRGQLRDKRMPFRHRRRADHTCRVILDEQCLPNFLPLWRQWAESGELPADHQAQMDRIAHAAAAAGNVTSAERNADKDVDLSIDTV